MDVTMEAILIMLAAYVLLQQTRLHGSRAYNWGKERFNNYKSKKSPQNMDIPEEE